MIVDVVVAVVVVVATHEEHPDIVGDTREQNVCDYGEYTN